MVRWLKEIRGELTKKKDVIIKATTKLEEG